MTTLKLDAALQCAVGAAVSGAAVLEASAVHVHGSRIAFAEKTGANDLVTEVDRASEKAVLEALRPSGFSVIGEEGGALIGCERDEVVWFVDPLDGTTCYTHGHPFHCVSIGLVVGGRPVLGVVHAPMLGVVWSGGPTLGVERRDLHRKLVRPLRVSPIATLRGALLATGFPSDRRQTGDDNLAAHKAVLMESQGVMRCGSAALDLALVADGTYEGYWERKIKPWDVAAGSALVMAAGGTVSDPWGQPFSVAGGSIAATNGLVHQELLDTLRPHLPAAVHRVDDSHR